MTTDLGSIAFDHYQRYASSARLIEALGGGISSALEVGANRQRLLAQFLPQVRFVFSDLVPLPGVEDGFIQADATALPFADAEFDAVVCLDVVEHMPREVRSKAIAEMVRVSRRVVVVAFPVDQPWVHNAESRANSYWKHYFGTDYPWLKEHQEFGLVEGDQIDSALRDSGVWVLRFGHADVGVWAGLMGAHFTKEKFPELEGLVAAADRLYNDSVFPGDFGEACYREFFVGVRDEADLGRVRKAVTSGAPPSEPASTLLKGLADALRPIADRTLRAEAGWSETAEHARRLDLSLSQVARRAEQAEASSAKAAERWRIAAERVRDLDASLDGARKEWGASAARVRELEASLDSVRKEWGASAARVRELEASLDGARKEWAASAARVRELDASLEDARKEWAVTATRVRELEGQLLEAAEELDLVRGESVRLQARVVRLQHRQRLSLQAAAVVAVAAALATVCWFWVT